MPQGLGFWVKEDRIILLRAPLEGTHISYITAHPEEFHLTREEIQRVYDTYQEELHKEGKAREELIKRVSQEGWIRVRHYRGSHDYWSIQTYDTVRERKYIVDFVEWCLKNTIDNEPIMTLNDELHLFSYKDESKEIYDYMSGGVERFLSEHNAQGRNTRKHPRIVGGNSRGRT